MYHLSRVWVKQIAEFEGVWVCVCVWNKKIVEMYEYALARVSVKVF